MRWIRVLLHSNPIVIIGLTFILSIVILKYVIPQSPPPLRLFLLITIKFAFHIWVTYILYISSFVPFLVLNNRGL